MPNDQTPRGYPLPHPDNIAVSDVVRIRTAIENLDSEIQEIENTQVKQQLETLIELWS